MADEITELDPNEVTFLEKFQDSRNSVVFKVSVHGRICVMKVVSALYLLLEFLAKCFSSTMIERHLIAIPRTSM